MADDAEVLQRVELALAQTKLVRRQAGFAVQQLAQLRDTLQPEIQAQGDEHGSNADQDSR